VLSPQPRIGELAERVRWFAQYGVREIWLYHQLARRLDVLTCRAGAVAATNVFQGDAPIRSAVLPQWTASIASLLHRE
jgi:Uma2 family endonuclease